MAEVFVVGSINQDFVLKVERRPKPGETVTDAVLSTHNGGKGANQAAAAALLGGSVALLGRVGDDGFGGALGRALGARGGGAGVPLPFAGGSGTTGSEGRWCGRSGRRAWTRP